SAIAKIALALPKARREEIERTRLAAADFLVPPGAADHLDTMRQAIRGRRKLRIEYLDSEQRESQRTVPPLALHFWSTTWSLAAWCEFRSGFRGFRLDRV